MLAEPAVILKAELVAAVSEPSVAVNVYPVPTRLMLSPEKVATPLEATTVTVPDSAPAEPDDGFVPMATVIVLVLVVTAFPSASSTVTIG